MLERGADELGHLRHGGHAWGVDIVDARANLGMEGLVDIFEQFHAGASRLDADVTSIEAARSRMELLEDIDEKFHSEIGPGIYDIHSPRIPSVAEMAELIRAALKNVPVERLWVNPDCGLKTRGYEETEASLRNMVLARDEVRSSL